MMKSHRLPRFKRATAIPAIQLTERDREIIRLVYRYRFLRSSQIVALLGEKSQQILRRLQLLYHHGYLERPRAQLEYFRHGGSHHMVYGLGNKGGTVLREVDGLTMTKLSWGEKNRAVGRFFFDHALFVADVMVALELACRRMNGIRLLTGDDLRLQSDLPQSRPFKWRVQINGGMKLGIIPDQVFALEKVDESGVTDRLFFFLEADRGTMPVIRKTLHQTSIYRKLVAYEATWTQSIHQTRFGFHRFRVLTVTTSAERVKSLVKACSQLESGRGLFLFAERSILEKPDILSDPIWQTGSQGGFASLLA